MNNFRFLTIAEQNALSSEELVAYKKAVAAYAKDFRKRNPKGIVAIDARLKGINHIPVTLNATGRNRVSFEVVIKDKFFREMLGDRIFQHPKVAHNFAVNSEFASLAHMALVLSGLTNKGTLKIYMELRVEGEEYFDKHGDFAGTYQTTHFAIDRLEYIPSAVAAAKIHDLTAEAATKGYNMILERSLKYVEQDAPDEYSASDGDNVTPSQMTPLDEEEDDGAGDIPVDTDDDDTDVDNEGAEETLEEEPAA